MSERSNQTAEIALRYYIVALDNIRLWPKVLHRMFAAFNNSVKYSSTILAPTQILYDFRTREALDLLRLDDPNLDLLRLDDPDTAGVTDRSEGIPSLPIAAIITAHSVIAEAFRRPAAMSEYRLCHIDAKNAIAFASLRMKEYYDAYHQFKYFNVGDLVNLRLHRGYQVLTIKFKKIGS